MLPRAAVLTVAALVGAIGCSSGSDDALVPLPIPSTSLAPSDRTTSEDVRVGDDVGLAGPELQVAAGHVGLSRLPYPRREVAVLAGRADVTGVATLTQRSWVVVWTLGAGELRWRAERDGADRTLHRSAERCRELELPGADERVIDVGGTSICAISGLAGVPAEHSRHLQWCDGDWCYGIDLDDPGGPAHTLQELVDLIEPGLRDLAKS